MFGIVATMSLFVWLYGKHPTNSKLDEGRKSLREDGRTKNSKEEKKITNIISYFLTYVIETLTNHGNNNDIWSK